MEFEMEFEQSLFYEPQVDYGHELSVGSQSWMRKDVESRDVPPPVVYDDEFGKTVLTYKKIGLSSGLKVYDIQYQHNREKPYDLSKFLGNNFFFHWTSHCRFSVLAQDGSPIVFIDDDALRYSRNHLLSLGHEIRHTHQRQVDTDLWKILGTQITNRELQSIRDKHVNLWDYINDLVVIQNIIHESNPKKISKLIDKIQHTKKTGFQMRGIDGNLPYLADQLTQSTLGEAPLGPTHLTQWFFGAYMKHTLPGVYLILDAMSEQQAWEGAIALEKKGIIHPGFHSDSERIEFMRKGLETYDEKYDTDAYTRWLERGL